MRLKAGACPPFLGPLLVSGVCVLGGACSSGGLGSPTNYSVAGTGAAADGGAGNSDSSGGHGVCTAGSESCACYPNETCNAGLTCISGVCVNLSAPGTGGATSAGSGGSANLTGGVANSTGGVANTTGGVANATGGLPSLTGGSSPATGGVPTATGGSGGADTRYKSGPWAGYVWTAYAGTTTTITPTTFTTSTPPFCVSGSVGPMTDYSGYAMIGYNINQTATIGTWTPTGTTGLTISYTNSGGSELRVQLSGPNGSTLASDRWCFILSAVASGSVTIPWGSFSTACWTPSTGTYYSGQPLAGVSLLVPGGSSSAVPYSFCLNSIAPY